MTTTTKAAIAFGVVAGIFGVAAFFGFTPFLKVVNNVEQLAGASPVGSNFTSAKIAVTVMAPLTSAASSSSMLNTDSNARYIKDVFSMCNGTNGQGDTLLAATTTVPNQGLQGNANYVGNIFGTTTTSSTFFYVASSTEGAITYTTRLWPAGTYLTFVYGTTSTYTVQGGTCNAGVSYFGS